jgi:hypothetical protein
MTFRRAALVAAIVAPLSTSCSPAPLTQLVVAVRVDAAIPGEINALDVVITTPGEGTHHVMTTLAGSADSLQSIGIRYVSGALGPVRIRATGTGAETIVQTRTTEFVRGESRLVTLVLTHACADVRCDEGATCELGRCVDAYVAGTSLPTWQGTLPEGMDANVSFADASNVDASTADAQLGMDAAMFSDAPNCAGDPLASRVGEDCTPADACQVGVYTCVINSVRCVGATTGDGPVLRSEGYACRAATGFCDVPESCDGRSLTCPVDLFRPAGLDCMGGVCDGVGGCGSCPAGMPCTAPGNPCMVGRYDCTMGDPVCTDLMPAPTATVCRPASSVCDVAETCSALGMCPSDVFAAATVTCRAVAGGGSLGPTCDAAEFCTGTSPLCPADGVLPASTVCRPAMGACDAPEICTGMSASCPSATTTMCDAGTDAFRPDAFTPPDAFTFALRDAGRDAFVPDASLDAGPSRDAGRDGAP